MSNYTKHQGKIDGNKACDDDTLTFTAEMFEDDNIYAEAIDLSKDNFENMLKFLSDAYYNDLPIIEDSDYDNLLEVYETKYGKYERLRAKPTQTREKILLEDFIGGLNKIKKDNEVQTWFGKHSGPYLVQDKIDGISAVLKITVDQFGKKTTKLFTTGDGYEGEDVSALTKYMALPDINETIRIRGELAVLKSSFEKIKNTYPNPKTGKPFSNERNLAGGIVNAARKNINPTLAKEITFFGLNILSKNDMTQSEQYQLLCGYGFTVPYSVQSSGLDKDILDKFYETRKKESIVLIDGLVIYQDIIKKSPIGKNPDHIIAFKGKSSIVEVEVEKIKWRASKDKLLKPRVYYSPTSISGIINRKATGHNAKTMINNQIGVGSKILITRSNEVIPQVVGVITQSKDNSYYPDEEVHGKYFWNDNKVELVLYEENDEVRREKLRYFLDTLKIKNLGRKRIKTLFKNGITNIKALVSVTPETLAKIFGPNMSVKIYQDLKSAIDNVPLSKLLTASGLFPNIAQKTFEAILEIYPDLIYMADMDHTILVNQLLLVKGIQKKSLIIAEKLPIFVSWLNEHPEITVESTEIEQYGSGTANHIMLGPNVIQNLQGQTIVFSGFRDTPALNLEKQIKQRGGKITTSVSKKTTFLVVKDVNDSTSKPTKAKQLGVKIVQLNDFIKTYLS